MINSSIAVLSFASLLSILPPPEVDTTDVKAGSAVVRHVSPAMAGLWELDTSLTTGPANILEAPETQDVIIIQSIQNSAGEDTGVTTINATDETLIVNETMMIRGLRLPMATADRVSDTNDINNSDINNSNSLSESASMSNTAVAQCSERYNFASDNNMWTISGAEWTQGRYMVQPPATNSSDALPYLLMETLYDNNEPDCTNIQVDQAGFTLAVYMDYRPDLNQMRWCQDPSGTVCPMLFRRILP